MNEIDESIFFENNDRFTCICVIFVVPLQRKYLNINKSIFCTMNKFYIILFALLVSLSIYANDMMHLLQGGFDAKILSPEVIDSLLNPVKKTSGEEAFSFDDAGRYKLEWENKQTLYRHSFFADYYLVDTRKNTRIRLSDAPVRDAQISPNGKYVVYAKADNNLYIYKVDFKTEVAITADGLEDDLDFVEGTIYNGVSDWLYEEEFGVTGLFAFSPDSKQLAYVRLNEENVPTFEWQTYLDNDAKGLNLYPASHSLRYPKAGEKVARASVCVYDMYYKTVRVMDLPLKEDDYIPRVSWTVLKESDKSLVSDVVAMVMNRDQTKMSVYKCNAKSTVCHPFYVEESKNCYVDFMLFDEWQWLSDGRVVVLSEKGGYVQAYMYSSQGVEQNLLTKEARDVTKLYGYDEKLGVMYYQAADGPLERQCYALNVKKGVTSRLTNGEGTHALTFSKDWKRCVDCYQSTTMPNKYTMYEVRGDRLEAKGAQGGVLLDNEAVAQAWKESGMPDKEFFNFTTERGDTLYGWMIKPNGFDSAKKYPVVMMQYSGPGSQRVTDTWRKRFGHWLAMEGYLVVCVDGRGTNGRGRAWRNATYLELGVKEAEDQISAARYIKSIPYVDGDKMALCGWSYGGYETLMCMSKQGEDANGENIWQCGIAIAPVTSWRLYDAAYTERYMRRPQVNEKGYGLADVINLADDLRGDLLLVHGLADDNVHAQHTWLYVDALVNAGKQFDMQIYPDDNHFLRNGKNYEHLHIRILKFLREHL